ncbi:Alpha/Beta hydrolase protein [Fusarium sp. MPI-SDFR-AT-0072]|uniref:palmitoyl-protein hydrolase n=1 Tax=Fusarium oxysporum f. sp. rapae TaxID=485398 RepID=A0A8J5NRU7_FUSOX|nr:Palmitoyl-protein thioesterase 1 [Fusarium oxysporum f. sp. rapae]KAH7144981.1 Alpha/Beta hydrolase protein [Fusarium sp. MPI-SDFR-AT-0072]
MSFPSLLRLGLAIGALAGQGYASPAAPIHTSDDLSDTPLPLVIWHGLGDQYSSDGMKSIQALAEAIHPGTFVHIIALDEDPSQDQMATFRGNVTDQVSKVCEELAKHPILSTAPAIDAIGISQGGQFLRGYVERCNWPQVRSLITFGSQHNGIIDFKACGATDWLCKTAMAVMRFGTWSNLVQSSLVPAQYYRNPATEADYNKYLENSNFLADINNERELKNEKYKANLSKLTNFVMWMFEDDDLVIPKESSWFEEVNGTEVIPLRARELYHEDWLGLRELDRNGGLRFRSAPGKHLENLPELLNKTIANYCGPWKRTFESDMANPGDGLFEASDL